MNAIAQMKGTVGHGRSLGHTVGMPTANLVTDYPVESLTPGVYAGIVEIRGERFLGVTNIGTRPTVDRDAQVTVETLILDFDRDIYGEAMTLTLWEYLRPIRRMESLEEVKAQVEKDSKQARALLTNME